MCGFTTDFDRQRAGYSPDRVDALVWALSHLLVNPMKSEGLFLLYKQQYDAIIRKTSLLSGSLKVALQLILRIRARVKANFILSCPSNLAVFAAKSPCVNRY
jgi:hypothetical protein